MFKEQYLTLLFIFVINNVQGLHVIHHAMSTKNYLCRLCIQPEIMNERNIGFYLSSSCGRRPWSGDYKTPSVCACVRPSVRVCASIRSSRFCINLNISFNYKDIFTKFAGNVYGYENLSLQNFSLILKNKMAAIANWLRIIKVL